METPAAADRIRELESSVEALRRFKIFCHSWLDAAGVPHDPDPEHTRESGCRISGRLRHLQRRMLEAEAGLVEHRAWLQQSDAAADKAEARVKELEAEVARLQKIIEGLTDRIAQQSELLSRKAEADHA